LPLADKCPLPSTRLRSAVSAGANVEVVQRLLGHTTAAMTLDRYGHLLSDDVAGVAKVLGDVIEGAAVLDAETASLDTISAAS